MLSYRPEIDGMRAIAIILVILFHAWGSTFPGGYVGVDIFFVISGYLITSIILKEMKEGNFTYMGFYARRARRILPALLAMTIVTTIAAFLLFLPADLIDYGKLIIYTMLFGSNFRLAATPGYFDQSMQENPLLHMWSLSVEEQFYLIWPTLLALTVRLLPDRKVKLAIIGLGALSLIAAEVLVHVWPRSAFFHLPARGWELLAGALLAMNFIPRIANRPFAEILSAAGLALMIAPLFLYDKEATFPGLAALAPVLGCALLIHATGSKRTGIAAFLSWAPIAFIGLISYSLYLWHWPIFAIANYLVVRQLTTFEASLCVLIAISAAFISWRFIERPFRRRSAWPSVLLAKRPWFLVPVLNRSAQVAFLVTAVLIASGSFFQESKGAVWRFSPDVLSVLASYHWEDADLCVQKSSGQPGLEKCEFGDNPADLILWGDSHARHYLPLIARSYDRGTGYFDAGCVPTLKTRLMTKSGHMYNPDCLKNNQYVMDEILRLKPKIVVMASRWTQVEELPYGREARPTQYLVDEAAVTTRQASRETFARAIEQTVSTLTAAGIKVVLMGQVPEMLVSPSRCFALSKKTGLAVCGAVTREEAEHRQHFINATLRSLSERHSNVYFFSPFAGLCDNANCYAIKDRSLEYFNNDHLNRNGAMSLVEDFGKALPEAFRLASASRTSSLALHESGIETVRQ